MKFVNKCKILLLYLQNLYIKAFIRTKSDIKAIPYLPMEVIREAERVLAILDENYTHQGMDGGSVVILEGHADIALCPVDIASSVYEFADRIKAPYEDYISVLYLIGTEYSITVIIPISIAPELILRGIEG